MGKFVAFNPKYFNKEVSHAKFLLSKMPVADAIDTLVTGSPHNFNAM